MTKDEKLAAIADGMTAVKAAKQLFLNADAVLADNVQALTDAKANRDTFLTTYNDSVKALGIVCDTATED